MTGFASGKGVFGPHSWTWELRSVNGKGLDMRLRVPEWLTSLEAALRAEMSKQLSRGNVTLSLRLSRDESQPDLVLNEAAMGAVPRGRGPHARDGHCPRCDAGTLVGGRSGRA